MRILYTVTMGIMMRHFKEFIGDLVKNGHNVDIACNEDEYKVDDFYRELGCEIIRLSCIRKPFSADNIKCYKEIKQLVEERKYDIVHCHTPVAAFLTRLACRKARKQGTKVIYTAHGFHFFKGAPLKNWLIYYPAEKFCAHFTDLLLTMNEEDFECAKKHIHAKKVEYVPGVGINTEKFKIIKIDKNEYRNKIGVPSDCVLLASVGELIPRKNHEAMIRVVAELKDKNIHYWIAGCGIIEEYLKELIRDLGVEDKVHMLGFRNDIAELYNCSDICCFPSFQEGLPVAVMEAMACGLPCVVSDIRGNHELIGDAEGGYLCDAKDYKTFEEKIALLIDNKELCEQMSKRNTEEAKKYGVDIIVKLMNEIYLEYIENKGD